ncbi:MAG: DUF3553 domain-containing protein [Acetobacteraceae bacterium]
MSIEPGCWVRLPNRPEWGVGQVQSAIGNRVTVNFEHAGKVLVNTAVVTLELYDDDAPLNGPQYRRK